jgi:predicted nucleic-acid-binding protein
VTNSLVIAEIVWTLESYYRIAREEIQSKVLAILNTPGLDVEDGELILQAILSYVEKRVDFIDAYNAAWMRDQDIQVVCTFDRKHFSRFEGLTIKIPGE